MKFFEHNPRQITKTQFERLEVDLDEFGDLSGIVHDLNSDEVITGNQRCRVIDLDKVTPVIFERFDPPTRTGTVAFGYIEWHGEYFDYRQVRWTRERCIAANIKANLDGGSWDFSELGNLGLDGDMLSAIGFDADLLKGWQQDTFALGEMLAAEIQLLDDNQAQGHADRIKPQGNITIGGFGVFVAKLETRLTDALIDFIKQRYGDDPQEALPLFCEDLLESFFS